MTKSVNYFIRLKIVGDKLSYKAIQDNGIVMGEFVMIKNNGIYNPDFESSIISQKLLNTIAGFANAMPDDISQIPTDNEPANYHVKLKSFLDKDIHYSIQLNDFSDYYDVAVISGVLTAGAGKVLV